MNMNNIMGRFTPERIAQSQILFNIPLYQRLFAWNEREVKGLLQDMKHHFNSEASPTPYYLGMLSCISNGVAYDLIDGQQRFSVMMLLAIVLRKYDYRWNGFLMEGKRLNFVARPKDKEYIVSTINGDGIDSDCVNTKMQAALKVVEDFMKTITDEAAQEMFAQNVYSYLSFFFSVLPDEYSRNPQSLNKYFEAMNTSGKGLEQHEILKVELLKGQQNQEWLTRVWNAVSNMSRSVIKRQENLSESDYCDLYKRAIELCHKGQYTDAFRLCESSFDKEDDVTIGEIKPERAEKSETAKEERTEHSILSFPDFLKMTLAIHEAIPYSYSYYRDELINVFHKHLKDAPSFYNTLLHYRLLFDFYIITREENASGNIYSILDEAEDKRAKQCVKQYESMLYVSYTPFYHWMKPLLEELSKQEKTIDCSGLLATLKRIDNRHRGEIPSIERLSYDSNSDRYWFLRLDYYLWERKEDFFHEPEDRAIVDDYIFRTNRSLEHLHPRSQKENSIWNEQDIHAFGNLAMISQSFNSQQGDDPVLVKFARITEQANNHALQSIKLYKMYLDAKGKPEGWSEGVMRDHEKKMYEFLSETFPSEDGHH